MNNDRQATLTDVHVHLQDKRFSADLDSIFERARQNGIERFLCSAIAPSDWFALQKLGRRHENVLLTYGIHPWFTRGISGDWENWLRLLLDETIAFNFPENDSLEKSGSKKPGSKEFNSENSDTEKSGSEKVTGESSVPKGNFENESNENQKFMPGIGEIGLDFALRDKNIDEQEDFFRKQLAIAHEMRIPVVLHTVHAVDRTLDILADYHNIALILFHGFVGTTEQIEKITDRGGFFSFSQRNVQPRNVKSLETIKAVPRDRILLESDGPTLVPRNSKTGNIAPSIALQLRNNNGYLMDEPAQIPLTLMEMAKIRKADLNELTQQIMINEKRFFRNWPRHS